MKTVNEVLSGISTKSSVASKKDMQDLVMAILTDDKHETKIGKLVKGDVILEDTRVLSNDFKELMIELLTKAGIGEDVATQAINEFKPSRKFADFVFNLHQEIIEQYVLGKGKNMPIFAKPVSKDDTGLYLSLKIGEPVIKDIYAVPKTKGDERRLVRKDKKRKVKITNRTLNAMKITL